MSWSRRGVILYPVETVEREDVTHAIAQAYVDIAQLETFENELAMFDKAPALSVDWGATETHGAIHTALTPELAAAIRQVIDSAEADGLLWYELDAATGDLVDTNDTDRDGAPLDWHGDGMPVVAGLVYRHNNELFVANQSHTSQWDWQPGAEGMLALFRPYLPPGEVRIWQHPGVWGYPPGARVLYPDEQGDIYINTLPEGTPNVWEPTTQNSGWALESPDNGEIIA
jgi:hypothetical protein